MNNAQKYARIAAINETLTKGEIYDAQSKQMIPLTEELKTKLREERYNLNSDINTSNFWSDLGKTTLEAFAWGAAIGVAVYGCALIFMAIAGNPDEGKNNA